MNNDENVPAPPVKPYLLEAYRNYFSDNECRTYIHARAVYGGQQYLPARVQKFVENGAIILNITPSAVNNYDDSGCEILYFQARFEGNIEDLAIPYGAIETIFSPDMELAMPLLREPYYVEDEKIFEQEAEKQAKAKSRIRRVTDSPESTKSKKARQLRNSVLQIVKKDDD